MQFNALGRVTSKTDQAGIVTQFEYDALGRLTAVVDALNQRTEYTYDEVGNKLTQTDANLNTTSWTYDAAGRVLSRTLPLGQVESFTYDANGNPLTHTDFNGDTTSFEYDNNNRLTRKVYADLSEETFTYDAVGNRLTATDSNGTTTYTYDSRNRLLSETRPDGTVLDYSYDSAGNRTGVTTTLPTSPTATVETTSYGYDALNRLATVTDNNLQVTSYGYDNVGNRASVTYPNGNVTSYSYDALNRLTNMETRDSTLAVIGSYAYTLGASGRRNSVVDHTGATTSYSYDDLYRLTGEDLTSHPVLGSVSNSYSYDAVGNRVASIENGVSTAYTYDANDRLQTAGGESYTYDANGNTLTVVIDNDVTTNTYDASNRLIQMVKTVSGTPVDDVSYQYDIDGIRTAKNDDGTITHYVIDKNRDYAQVLNELDANNTPQVSYVYGDDLISQNRAANDSYYLYDGLGSTRALTDATGTVTDTYDYSAYGTEIDSTGVTENSYKFTGEQFDAESGNIYLRARYLNPATGRFMSMDTYQGRADKPVTLHKYLYANIDPANNIDPTGNFSISGLMTAVNVRGILTTTARASYSVGRSAVGSGGRAVSFLAHYMGRMAVNSLKPIFRAVGRMRLQTAAGRRITTVDKFKRFFVSPTRRHPNVEWGPIGRHLKKAFPSARWEQHHVGIQAKWFRPGSPSQWYPGDSLANLGLQRLGNAGFNLMAIPRGLNNALGRSAAGTAGLAIGSYGLVGYAVYEIIDAIESGRAPDD